MQNKSYTYILTNNNGKVMYIGVPVAEDHSH